MACLSKTGNPCPIVSKMGLAPCPGPVVYSIRSVKTCRYNLVSRTISIHGYSTDLAATLLFAA